jgi:hypothetical protein
MELMPGKLIDSCFISKRNVGGWMTRSCAGCPRKPNFHVRFPHEYIKRHVTRQIVSFHAISAYKTSSFSSHFYYYFLIIDQELANDTTTSPLLDNMSNPTGNLEPHGISAEGLQYLQSCGFTPEKLRQLAEVLHEKLKDVPVLLFQGGKAPTLGDVLSQGHKLIPTRVSPYLPSCSGF